MFDIGREGASIDFIGTKMEEGVSGDRDQKYSLSILYLKQFLKYLCTYGCVIELS